MVLHTKITKKKFYKLEKICASLFKHLRTYSSSLSLRNLVFGIGWGSATERGCVMLLTLSTLEA